MECPNCKEKYKFQDVPLEYKNMKFLVTEFICPFCDVWITPGKTYKFLLAVFIVITITSVICVISGEFFSSPLKWLGISLSFMSFLLLISAKLLLKYEIKK